jgi:hypothetical protein
MYVHDTHSRNEQNTLGVRPSVYPCPCYVKHSILFTNVTTSMGKQPADANCVGSWVGPTVGVEAS